MIKCDCGYKGHVKTLAHPKRMNKVLVSEVCPKCNGTNFNTYLINTQIPNEVKNFLNPNNHAN